MRVESYRLHKGFADPFVSVRTLLVISDIYLSSQQIVRFLSALADETAAPVGVQQRLMRHSNVATAMNVQGPQP
jgi:hypothetical protein